MLSANMTQELEIASTTKLSEVMSSLIEHSYSQEEGDNLNKVPDSTEVVGLLDQVEQQLVVGGKFKVVSFTKQNIFGTIQFLTYGLVVIYPPR